MSTEGTLSGHEQSRELFERHNTAYEDAYKHNPFKKACVQEVIRLLKPGSRVLDIGCGTGVPVAQMLADADMEVVATDIAPQMVEAARERVPKATITVDDMVEYQPEGAFDAIFLIYSHLGLTYKDVHALIYRLAKALKPGGLLAIGTSPTNGEKVPADDPTWDETKTYVEDKVLIYWGEAMKHTLFSRQGNLAFLTSMGLEIVYETYGSFKPENPMCGTEEQQYYIGKRVDDKPLEPPKPLPKSKA